MLDPVSFAALITSSAKLLERGLKLAHWDGWTHFPSHDRLTWLTKLLGLSGEVVGAIGDSLKHLAPASARPEQAVHLWAIHVACFGEALAAHWGGSEDMSARTNEWGQWFAPAWVRARAHEIDAAFRFAADLLERIPQARLPRSTWLTEPTASPMYQALWKAFTRHESPEGATSLILCERDGDVQAFERAFARAFRDALARGGNAELRAFLLDGQPRGDALRQLLVAEMAAWRHKHVFAGVDTSEGIPELPLGETYVEPTAEVRVGNTKWEEPVLMLLDDLLSEHRVVYVTADFGMGKSLTARTLAWKWASAYLDPHTDTPSVDRIFPVHIRCGHTSSFRDGLDGIIRRALKRNAEAVGVSVRLDDTALAPPPSEQRAVIILDGLDELVMTTDQTRDLIRELLDHATDRQRFIVFSRPEALSHLYAEPSAAGIPNVKLNRFNEHQIDEWLAAWPTDAPTRRKLEAHRLGELASIPILLFMLTLTWQTFAAEDKPIPRVQIYEAFFDTLAAGKYERGGETHPYIRAAAERTRDTLVEAGDLPSWKEPEEGKRRAVEAIRWLMDRVAWEAVRHEFAGDMLSRRHVENILADELHLPDSTLEQVRIGLLLGMQAQLSGGVQQFFFGHRSFLEFAAARYWERQLRHVCTSDRHHPEAIERTLTGAPLPHHESRVLPFLREMLDAWDEQDRRRLLAWSRRTFEDESIRCRGDLRQTLRNDQRTLVRQSALAIGCDLARSLDERFDIHDGAVLLTISAWWSLAKKFPLIHAPGIRGAARPHLIGLCAPLANLTGADLEGANLRNAILKGAMLGGATLTGATLSGANLIQAKMIGAQLDEANLVRAHLTHANLECAGLRRANLEGTDLKRANLIRTTLSSAILTDADLSSANLFRADLEGAEFVRANLGKANLVSANLRGANLTGANLRGANLRGADLRGCIHDSETRWPAGFSGAMPPPLPDVSSSGSGADDPW
ncbi:pentapeptide repeat-containing protein [Nannocystis radixulma]|uniref:Pentapeptide repeat-containing protein n=1 Tax=Nannocystis radixulma TaxID=2995305 RepID=A0ABT5BET3_9BACT|nr:pentapeptide repeat-containing protein [Nannocystis radixulma]MDC0672661.1 pentapeptide repeat-containing protein [Nannocystis radixulma]